MRISQAVHVVNSNACLQCLEYGVFKLVQHKVFYLPYVIADPECHHYRLFETFLSVHWFNLSISAR